MLNIITKFLFKETIIENIIIFYIISVSFIIKYDNEIFFFFFFFSNSKIIKQINYLKIKFS